MKTLENDDFYIKIVNFDQFRKKKSPSGGPPTGSHLRRWGCFRRTVARGLNGAENIGENHRLKSGNVVRTGVKLRRKLGVSLCVLFEKQGEKTTPSKIYLYVE